MKAVKQTFPILQDAFLWSLEVYQKILEAPSPLVVL